MYLMRLQQFYREKFLAHHRFSVNHQNRLWFHLI